MFSVIAGGVVPAAVNVEDVRALELQMVVGLVEQARRPLALEIINDTGQRVALQKTALNLKRKRAHRAAAGRGLEQIISLSIERTEIGGPKNPILPLVNRAGF